MNAEERKAVVIGKGLALLPGKIKLARLLEKKLLGNRSRLDEMPIRNSQLEKQVAGNESTPVIAKHRDYLELGAGHLFLLYFLQRCLT